MDHVVSPEDVEPIEVVDLEVDVTTCGVEGCNTDITDTSHECDDCHAEFCGDHVQFCHNCDDPVCASCVQVYENQNYCHYCRENTVDCCACSSTINIEWDGTAYCESHDAHCCENCYSGDHLCNDCATSSDSGSGGATAAMGTKSAAPWELRGVHDAELGYEEDTEPAFAPFDALTLWGVDQNLSLNEGAADFYLLEVVQHNVDCGEIVEPMLVVMAEEAKAARAKLVATYDATFCGYADMAIGGELRYHRAVGGGRHLPEERTEAWRYWKLLRDRGGVELLLETATLFEEIVGGSVGGKRWADAARLLHARLTNRITPEQWVDRVFTLQHNGGAFTNKINWGPDRNENGGDITAYIGPAHDRNPTDFHTLAGYASPGARALLSDWWPAANKNRMRWRQHPWVYRTPMHTNRLLRMHHWFTAFVNAAWSTSVPRNHAQIMWQRDPERMAQRFSAFYVSYHLAIERHVHMNWPEMDKRLARQVVHYTTDADAPTITPATMHRIFPAYLHFLCQRIIDSTLHVDKPGALQYLHQRGFVIPMEYRDTAQLSLELELF